MDEGQRSFSALDLSCCADLYQHPLVRSVLGDSLHPGGLALTRRLAKEINLASRDQLLDVACGRGASALMLAQVYKCRVTGLDREKQAIEQAKRDARRFRLESRVTFAEGDAGDLPFPPSSFDVVLCECATSMFSDKLRAFAEMGRVVRSGGYVIVSDVTFRPKVLPPPLDARLAQTLCIPVGTGPDDYVSLLGEAGFTVARELNCSESVVRILDRVGELLGSGWGGGTSGDRASGPFDEAAAALRLARELVQQGDLGYWAYIAQRTG